MKQIRSKLTYIFSFMLLFVVFLGVSPKQAEAKTPLPQWSGAELTNSNTVIDSKYTFIPEFEKGRSSLSVSGGRWRRLDWASYDSRKFRSFHIFDAGNQNQKGNAVARYHNIGKFNGEELDLRIVIRGWKIAHGQVNGGDISFEENKIAVATSGFDWVDMEWQFVRAGTSQRVHVDGYFTISDVDMVQGIDFSDATFRSINQFYISNSRNGLWYAKQNSGWHRFSTDFTGDVPDTKYDDKYAFTFTFSGSSLRLSWLVDWSQRDYGRPIYAEKFTALGDYFFYTDIKPARFDTIRPRKRVNISRMRHPHNTDQDLIYDVTFDVPSETRRTYYSDLLVSDTLDSTLSAKDVRIYDDNSGRDVSSRFNISTNGQRIEARAKSASLNGSSFYNSNYRMQIRASIRTNVLNNIFSDRSLSDYTILNKATLTIDKKSKTSRTVQTVVEAPVYYRSTVNHIDIESGETITSSSREILEEEPYEEHAIEGLKRGIYNYKSLHPKVQSGIMTKDMVINFYYRVPKLTVKNEGINIYTNKSSDPQPVDISLSSGIKDSGDSLSDFVGGRVRLSIYDRTNNRLVWSEIKSINTIFNQDKYSFNIPNQYLNKGSITSYRYQIDIVDRGVNGYELITNNDTVRTYGHKASEKTLTNNDKVGGGIIKYDEVVLTEANRSSYVREHKEYVTIDNIAQPSLKSGYGYEFNPRIYYHMDGGVASRVKGRVPSKTNTVPRMNLDERIVDLNDGYISQHMSGGKVPIMLDMRSNSGSDSSSSRDTTYQLPLGYLSRTDGRIWYSNRSDRVRAGNKMYVPVWIKELGDYGATLEHTQRIGSNLIGLDVDNIVNVYAYMLNHTDSETPELDELLLHPMHKDDELFNWEP